MTSMKIVQFSRPPTPLVHLRPKFFHPPWPWTSNFKWTPPLQMMTNQLKENIIQGWLLYVIRSFLYFGSRFQYQLINQLIFLLLYTLVCAVAQKYHEMSFVVIHIFTRFAINLFYFHGTATVPRACERTKSKEKQNQVTSHSNWRRVLLFDLAHKQCNGIIKGWLHCLRSESKGRFLVNNILVLGLACLVIALIQFSLIKRENKDWTSRTLANPPPPTSNNISFLP